MFVSESKFRSAPHDFIPHILASPPNRTALAALITKPAVEAALLVRLGNKARLYGAELDAQGRLKASSSDLIDGGGDGHGEKEGNRIKVEEVVKLYRDWVIPLTKDVEVDYLVHRLDGVSDEQIQTWLKNGEK